MEIIELLSQDNYLMYNLSIAKTLGVYEAILIGELARKHCYWKANNRLTEDGYFFITREDIEKDTGLSAKMQRSAFKHLIEEGIINSQQIGGIDRSTYYKINNDRLSSFLTIERDKRALSNVTKGNDRTLPKGTFECDERLRSNVTKGNATNTDITNTNITNTDITNNLSSKEESNSSKSETAKNIFNKNSKNPKDIVNYIETLTYLNEDIRNLLKNWLFNKTIGIIGNMTLGQFIRKLEAIKNDCLENNTLNQDKLKRAIEFSISRNYRAFYLDESTNRNVNRNRVVDVNAGKDTKSVKFDSEVDESTEIEY